MLLFTWNMLKLYAKMNAGTSSRILQRKASFPSETNISMNQHEARYNGQNLRYVLNSPDLCRRHGQADYVTLVILVITSAPYFKARQNWRNSVQIREHKKVRVLFVVEKPQNDTIAAKLKEEHRQFGDVICMNFAADNKVAESLRCLSGLRWIQNFCPQTGYVLIARMNAMVMVSTVLEYLDKLPPSEKETLYSGVVVHRNALVKRSGQWAVTKEEWPNGTYPDYIQYDVIFLSGKSASIMADTSRKTEVFKIPDVYFGILAKEAKDRIIASEAIIGSVLRHENVKDEFTDFCKMTKFLYIIADNPDQDMQKGWDTLRDRKELLCQYS
ncbi:beta-1,3-galactosyltransferase 1-like [Lineus longissimus]|uniref:beta-1,3-galactosyltransferase 1-like n=1 Tax=Lineus longissimus TaxID=88925 RepID=UPI00315D2E52